MKYFSSWNSFADSSSSSPFCDHFRLAHVHGDVAELVALERRRPAGPDGARRISASMPRQQLDRLERLGEVVVGAELQADHAIDDLGARGQHQDRRLDALLANRLARRRSRRGPAASRRAR